MKNLKKHFNVFVFAAVLLGVQSLMANEGGVRAYYGDRTLDRVVVMDVENMTFIGDVYTVGVDPYPVDRAGSTDKLYATTRKSSSVDVIDMNTLALTGLIELPHYPRSAEAYNAKLGLQLISGANKPMASLIDVESDTVVASVGLDEELPVGDYGGSNATGHPFWFNKSMFALIDRPNRTIHLYKVKKRKSANGSKFKVKLLDSLTTPTAVHHFVVQKRSSKRNKRVYFALAEGSPASGVAPTVLKIKLTSRNKLRLVKETALSETDIEIMGSHHADMHPDGKHMYIGSREGNIFVLNTRNMKIVKKIPAGIGAGHTKFVPGKDLAIITNHNDTFLTIIDSKNHTWLKNVTVSGPQENGQILQSHTSYVDANEDYFYAFATDSGIFYELDLNTLEVNRTVDTGGTPLQGVFISQ
ncbi:MAG: hypothetical protein K0U47_00805 [Epsilonproteobacteria bacterium]|nr:hypothetical protein [Campylobacterota bacterium]